MPIHHKEMDIVTLPLSTSAQIVDNVPRICGGRAVVHQHVVVRWY